RCRGDDGRIGPTWLSVLVWGPSRPGSERCTHARRPVRARAGWRVEVRSTDYRTRTTPLPPLRVVVVVVATTANIVCPRISAAIAMSMGPLPLPLAMVTLAAVPTPRPSIGRPGPL